MSPTSEVGGPKEAPKEAEATKSPPKARYPLRVDVAKPAVMYQPTFGADKAKPSPSRPEAALASSSSGATGGGGGAASGATERILGKRRAGGRTEFLVKRQGDKESTWEPAKAVSAAAMQEFEAKRQSRQLLQGAKQPKQAHYVAV